MTQVVQSGGAPPQNEDQPVDPNKRLSKAREELKALFSSCPVPVKGDVLSSGWSRECLEFFVAGGPELLAWARENELPSALCELAGVTGVSPRFIRIYEQLREFHSHVAFRREHLSQYRLGKLQNSSGTDFVGPYDMPAIGTVLPLLSGLIVAHKWPELLDKPRPERKPENNNWKRRRRLGASETHSWHW